MEDDHLRKPMKFQGGMEGEDTSLMALGGHQVGVHRGPLGSHPEGRRRVRKFASLACPFSRTDLECPGCHRSNHNGIPDSCSRPGPKGGGPPDRCGLLEFGGQPPGGRSARLRWNFSDPRLGKCDELAAPRMYPHPFRSLSSFANGPQTPHSATPQV